MSKYDYYPYTSKMAPITTGRIYAGSITTASLTPAPYADDFFGVEKATNDKKVFLFDKAGLEALPVGARIKSVRYTKPLVVTTKGFQYEDSGAASYHYSAADIEFDAPYEVLNVGILAEKPLVPADKPSSVKTEDLREGDIVRFVAYSELNGKTGIVGQRSFGYFRITPEGQTHGVLTEGREVEFVKQAVKVGDYAEGKGRTTGKAYKGFVKSVASDHVVLATTVTSWDGKLCSPESIRRTAKPVPVQTQAQKQAEAKANAISPVVGDWVKVNELSHITGRKGTYAGKVGQVTKTSGLSTFNGKYSQVKFEGNPYSTGVYNADLAFASAPVKPLAAPKFQVGDRVTVSSRSIMWVGQSGVVTKVTPLKGGASCGDHYITIKRDDKPTTIDVWEAKADLQAIEDGDRVRGSNGYEGTLLPKGQSMEYSHERTVQKDDGGCYFIKAAGMKLISKAPAKPVFAVGDKVTVSADAKTKTGGGVFYKEKVNAEVIRGLNAEGNIMVKSVTGKEKGRTQVIDPKFATKGHDASLEIVALKVGDKVKTAEQLEALRTNSVVLDVNGMAWQKREGTSGGRKWVRVRIFFDAEVVQRTSKDLMEAFPVPQITVIHVA